MLDIQQNLLQIRNEISQICRKSGHPPEKICLVAVSKTKPLTLIADAYAHGQRDFAENYVQEGLEKILQWNKDHLVEGDPITWHFIGKIQSNKCLIIARHFSWVHSLASVKHAKRLNDFRKDHQSPLNICIQIQIQSEQQRNGLNLDEVEDFFTQIINMPRLKLRGLMCVLPKGWLDEKADYGFNLVQKKFIELKNKYPNLDTLSLGMSNDYVNALNNGSNMIRLGSAIFGQRKY